MQEAWRLTQESSRELSDPEYSIFLMVVVQIRKSGGCKAEFNMKVTCRLKQNIASVLLCDEQGQECGSDIWLV